MGLKEESLIARRELHGRVNAMSNFADFVLYINKDAAEPFRHSKVHHFICDKLQAAADGNIKRLILNCPPDTGKSELSSVHLPAFLLGHNHRLRIGIISHTSTFSQKISRRIKQVMRKPAYKALFPHIVVGDAPKEWKKENRINVSDAVDKWEVMSRHDKSFTAGSVLARGISSGLQGERIDILIVDDLYANREDANSRTIREKIWDEFQTGVISRLTPNAIVIVVNTRFHLEDLTGNLLRNQTRRGEKMWEHICLTAIAEEDDVLERKVGEALWPEKWSIKKLLELKNGDMSMQDWEALYQQSPIVRGGSIIKREDWMFWSKPKLPSFEYSIMSIDTATRADETRNNDFHAITMWILFRPPEEKLAWEEVIAIIQKRALSDEEILEQLIYKYEEDMALNMRDFQQNYVERIDITLQENLLIAKQLTPNQIRDIRLGKPYAHNVPLKIIREIQVVDLELSQMFGQRLPPSMIRQIMDSALIENKGDLWDFHHPGYQEIDGVPQYTSNLDDYEQKVYSWKKERPLNLLMFRAWQGRVPYPNLKQKVSNLYRGFEGQFKFPVDKVLIEDKAAGHPLIQDLRNMGIVAQAWNPGRLDKVERANLASPFWSQGRIYAVGKLVTNPNTGEQYRMEEFDSSIEQVIHQCEIFPNGPHDDLVDSVTQVCAFVRQMMPIKLMEDRHVIEDDLDPDEIGNSTTFKVITPYDKED